MAVNSKRLVCSQSVLNQQEAIEQLIYQFTTYWRQIVQKYPEITSYLQNHITPFFQQQGEEYQLIFTTKNPLINHCWKKA